MYLQKVVIKKNMGKRRKKHFLTTTYPNGFMAKDVFLMTKRGR